MAYATSTTNPHPTPGDRRPAAPSRGAVGSRAIRRRPRGRGFTLIEALTATAVLAVTVIAVGTSLSTTVRQTDVVEGDSTSLLLARQLMEEIAAKPYADPASGTVTTNSAAATNAAAAVAAAAGTGMPPRSLYNDVGDYHGYADTIDASNPVTSLQGKTATVTNSRKYTRAVAVQFRATPAGAAVTSGDYALITVTVTGPTGRPVSVWRLVTSTTLMQSSAF